MERRSLMKTLANLATALLLVGCATNAQPRAEETPQCTSLCHNRLATCTERHPGDYSACRDQFSSCEQTCEGNRAIERMEREDEEVVVPTDAMDDAAPVESPDPQIEESEEPLE